jgi:large subunit ribosomal protein L6
MIKGVTDGYTKELEIIGIGYKAQVQGNNLNLQLGFSHPVNIPIPEGIKIETPKQTQIVVRGIDKEKVGRLVSEIRAICPPEPYKGKGIRYFGEYVKKKIGKAQATGGK